MCLPKSFIAFGIVKFTFFKTLMVWAKNSSLFFQQCIRR